MKWLVLFSLIVANVVKVPSPTVRTEGGLVRGRVSDNGRFYQYFGIPYGTVNEQNRFQAPLPVTKWKGIFDAIEENTRCPQKMAGIIIGDEDCLKLNIYTPLNSSPRKPLPVMVFIHGGAFYEGTGSPFLYGGDYFAENGVVFVGINYRLNAEGFLCLGIKEAPGNAGLKDQLAALRWIKNNIRAFGGDPDNVTLFGESAGAVSTSFLILSPSARGLFHRAILQSGATTAPWAMQHDPIRTASKLAKQFGYNLTDPYKIYKVLSKRSYSQLINAVKCTKNKNSITSEILFVPCVERNIEGVEPIVTEYPGDIILSGNYTKLPMIIGFNDNEGIYFTARNFGTSVKRVNPVELLQPDLEFPTEQERYSIAETIRNYYFSSGKEEMIMDMVDLYSDLHFKYPTVIESEMYAKTTDHPIYYYLFKYSGTFNMPKMISLIVSARGASHADELFYMFRPHSIPLPQRQMESKMIKRMVTLWTNFAKYNDPTPKTTPLLPVRWRPSRQQNPVALVIDHQLSTGRMWDEPSVRLWNDTYSKYRRRFYGFR